MFCCGHCVFYSKKKDMPATCCFKEMHPEAGDKKIDMSFRMASQMPDCFLLEPLKSPMAEVLDRMQDMGIKWFEHDRGWPTIVSRLNQRADRFGFFTGISQMNLEKYGS
jgi:hypothetical protein